MIKNLGYQKLLFESRFSFIDTRITLASRGHPFFSTVCFLLEELILFIFVSKEKFEDT
jgi:hypothetical protein